MAEEPVLGAASEPPPGDCDVPGEPPVEVVPPLEPVAVGGASEYWMPLESA